MHETQLAQLKDKKVALLGFGVENRSLLPILQQEGAVVTICDRNEALAATLPDVATQLGPDYLKNLDNFDIIFRSPGLPYLTREIQEARQQGTIVSSQTKFFFERCPATIIGITGTKGKSTTTALIGEMLKQAATRGELPGAVYVAGNIGTPPVTLLDKVTDKDWMVVELSSFQLQDLTISPDIAVVLNITIDHLDHHRDEAEYIAAKKNIVRYQQPSDFVVLNEDAVTSVTFADETPAQAYFYSREKSVDQGAFVERRLGDDVIILRPAGAREVELCKTEEVALTGAYNLENITAAATAAHLAGVSAESIRQAIKTFTGLPHRLQLVGTKQGVRYYDDSKSTTPDSTVAAVLAFNDPVILIVGGSSKGADFTELVAEVTTSSVEQVICIGQEGEQLYRLFSEAGGRQILHRGGQTMTEIVNLAAAISEPGNVVLLSPAAASFDMFKSAEDRGDQFQAAVQGLPQ